MSNLIFRSFLVLAAFAFWSGTSAAQALQPQTSNQSGVTVKVTPRTVHGEVWEFEVVFDTHSQELKDDLMKNAVLVTTGGSSIAPATWQGDPPGGHHRKGILRFNAVSPMPATMELRITRPGEAAPRSFNWHMK